MEKFQSNLLCCRACLETEGKLYNVHDYNLGSAFSLLSGVLIVKNQLPQHLCEACTGVLRHWAAFKNRCVWANMCLKKALRQGKLNMEYIRSFDRSANGLVNMETIPLPTPEHNQGEKEPDEVIPHTPMPETNFIPDTLIPKTNILKTENNLANINKTVDVDDIINSSDDEFELSDLDDDFENSDLENQFKNNDSDKKFGNADSEQSKNNLDDVFETSDDDAEGVYVVQIDNDVAATEEIETEVLNESDAQIEDEDSDYFEPSAKMPRNEIDELNDNFTERPNKHWTQVRQLTFEKLRDTYNMDIITLTEEEQLQEIEMRKSKQGFLEARFGCELCGKIYQMEAAYNNHRARHDPSLAAYPCMICSLHYKNNSRRLYHQESHQYKFVCRDCGVVTRTRSTAARHHQMAHGGQTRVCRHCGKVFHHFTTHLSHERLAHPEKNVACDMCGETFIGRRGLLQHKAKMHAARVKKFKCQSCEFKFDSLAALKRHAATDGPHWELRPCALCGENCASEELLQQHAAECHPRCEECCASFLDAASFDTHVQRKHLGRRAPHPACAQPRAGPGPGLGPGPGPRRRRPRRPGGSGGDSDQLVCDICGKILAGKISLYKHKRNHEGARPFACSLCQKTFTQNSSLKMHIRTHTGEKPYLCAHCPFAFSNKKNLQRHISVIHMGIRPDERAPCEICGRVLASVYAVRLHVRTVHCGLPGPKRKNRRQRPREKTSSADEMET